MNLVSWLCTAGAIILWVVATLLQRNVEAPRPIRLYDFGPTASGLVCND